MEKATIWKSSVKKAYYGFLIQNLGSILAIIVGIIGAGAGVAGLLQGEIKVGPMILSILLGIATVVGYIIYLIGINGIKKATAGGPDAAATNNLFIGVILELVGAIIGFIPVIGLVGSIVGFVGLIFMLIGFNKMKNSTTLPALAASGSSKLFIAMILGLVGGLLGLIPVAGAIIKAILSIVCLILGIMGWASIAKSELRA